MSSLKVQFQDVQLPGWPLQPESFPPAAWIRKIQIPQLAGSIQFHSISALLYIIQIKIMTALMTSKWLILKPIPAWSPHVKCKQAFHQLLLSLEKGQPIQPTIGIYRSCFIHSKTQPLLAPIWTRMDVAIPGMAPQSREPNVAASLWHSLRYHLDRRFSCRMVWSCVKTIH